MSRGYDTIIIGAGMSGLAAGIRLAMYGKKVCIVEKHLLPGGLNSYYRRDGRDFDVGLHALTNFIKKGEKGKPFSKILRQLRIPYEDFKLQEQSHSKTVLGGRELKFSNDIELFKTEISSIFPKEIDNFTKLLKIVEEFDPFNNELGNHSTRSALSEIIKDKSLIEMLMMPILFYGSATPKDLDFYQFVIMFRSLFLEGFSRPEGGVRTIIKLLVDKYLELGGELSYNSEVLRITTANNKVQEVIFKNGQTLNTKNILSSAGLLETMALLTPKINNENIIQGDMTFVEAIFVLDKKLKKEEFDSTIVFYNKSKKFNYETPDDFIDNNSAVICCPDNYVGQSTEGEGIIRVTKIANFKKWKNLERSDYVKQKEMICDDMIMTIKNNVVGFNSNITFKDIFTPLTVKRYTGHLNGVVYGAQTKLRDGKTPIEGLYICGNDQGFVGIVGTMLSGISMANAHCLMD